MCVKNIFGGTMIFKYETSDGTGWYKNFKECWNNEPKVKGKEKTIYLVSYWKRDNGECWHIVEELPLHKRPSLKMVKEFMEESMFPKIHCECDFSDCLNYD